MTLAVVSGGFLRLFRLGQKPLWLGEIQELVSARSDRWAAQILDSGTDVVGFTWHHLVWLAGLDPTPFASRLLAALAGTLIVVVVYLLGARLYSRLAGGMAAILMALSFYHIYHSQDARAVSYLTFFYSLSWLAMVELYFHGSGKSRRWMAGWGLVYAASAGLTGLSHAIGGVYLVFQGAFFIGMAFWPGWKSGLRPEQADTARLLRRYLVPAIGALVVCSFQLYVVADYAYAFSVTRVPISQTVEIEDLFLLKLFLAHLGGGVAVLQVVQLLCFVLGLWSSWVCARWTGVLLATWFFVPTAALYAVTTGGGLARFEMYHLLPCLVPFVLAVSAGLARALDWLSDRQPWLRPRVVPVGLALALLLAASSNVVELGRYYQRPIRLYFGEDLRAVAQTLEKSALTENDVVVVNYGEHLVPLNFYAGSLLQTPRVVCPWKPADRNWQFHLLLRAWFQATDSDVVRLLPDQIETVDSFRRHPPAAGGRVFVPLYWMPSMENKGYDDYYRWLTGWDVFVRKPFVQEDSLPAGFTVHRLAGVDLVVSDPAVLPLQDALDLVIPLVVANAPPLLRDMAPDVYGPISGAD